MFHVTRLWPECWLVVPGGAGAWAGHRGHALETSWHLHSVWHDHWPGVLMGRRRVDSRWKLWVLPSKMHNFVTNPILLAVVISDSRPDRWAEWGGGRRHVRDNRRFRHLAPRQGCRQGERWVFDLLSHQKLFRDLGVAQPGPARLGIIPGSSVSTGTRWAGRECPDLITLVTLARLTPGLWSPPSSPTWGSPATVTSTRSTGRTCGQWSRVTSHASHHCVTLQVGCARASPGWQGQVHWLLRIWGAERGKCEDCDLYNCEDQILKTFLNSLH